jgi:hypothetical protein
MNTQNTKQRFFKSGKAMTPTEQKAIEAKEAKDAKKAEHWFIKNGRKARFGRFVDAMRKLQTEANDKFNSLTNGSE